MFDILFWGFIGYALAVLFPVPWISRFILDTWTKVLGKWEQVKANYAAKQ